MYWVPASIFAPAFYFTISYFITPDRSWKIKDYFHFWLAILYLLTLLYAISYLDSFQDIQAPAVVIINYIFMILYCINAFYYCTLSWIKLKKHEKNIRLFTSTIENVDLRWLKYIVIRVVIMFCFFIISEILNILPFHYDTIIQLLYLIGFFIIGYFFIKQKEIYPFTNDQKNEIIYTIIKETSEKQVPRKLIDDHKLEELKTVLLHIMENDKPFLDCELTLAKLATMMDISLHQLSYLINTGFNENFYQFINRYRIEEAKKLILDKNMSHLNFQGIGFEVGFNSKSAF